MRLTRSSVLRCWQTDFDGVLPTIMASLVAKWRDGRTYFYLVESARPPASPASSPSSIPARIGVQVNGMRSCILGTKEGRWTDERPTGPMSALNLISETVTRPGATVEAPRNVEWRRGRLWPPRPR